MNHLESDLARILHGSGRVPHMPRIPGAPVTARNGKTAMRRWTAMRFDAASTIANSHPECRAALAAARAISPSCERAVLAVVAHAWDAEYRAAALALWCKEAAHE